MIMHLIRCTRKGKFTELEQIRNIMIITTNFPPSSSIGTQRILKICKYLDQRWNVHILTLKKKYFPNKGDSVKSCTRRLRDKIHIWRTGKFDLLSLLKDIQLLFFHRELKANFIEKNKIEKIAENKPSGSRRFLINKFIRIPAGFVTDMLEFPDREITWLPFAVFKGYQIIKKNNIDVLFSSAPRHSNHLIATILKLLTRKRLIIEFRDPWTRSPWDNAEMTSTALARFKHRILIVFEKWVVESADQVIFVTNGLKVDFEGFYHYLPKNKFKVFYNGYDPDYLNKQKSVSNLRRIKNSKRITFSHIGTLYKRRNPVKIIEAIKILIEEKDLDRDKVLFQFVGIIAENLVSIKSLAIDFKLDDVIKFIPQVSYDESLKYMSDSDVLILLQPITRMQIPAKFYDYICCDKPILALAEKHSEVEKIVDGHFGIFADYNDINEIKKSILFLKENPGYYRESIKSTRELFDISKSIKYLEEILK